MNKKENSSIILKLIEEIDFHILGLMVFVMGLIISVAVAGKRLPKTITDNIGIAIPAGISGVLALAKGKKSYDSTNQSGYGSLTSGYCVESDEKPAKDNKKGGYYGDE